MRVLFNCTTNVVGGGVKNAALFIQHALADDRRGIEWRFVLSPAVEDALGIDGGRGGDQRLRVFPRSPARDSSVRVELEQFSREQQADIVYTMAGPAYVRFPVPHVMGLSNPYVTHVDWVALRMYGALGMAERTLHALFQLYQSRHADHFIFQTEHARQTFCRRARVPIDRTSIVPNAFDERMRSEMAAEEGMSRPPGPVRIFCPGAPYAHKGFQLVPRIAKALRQRHPGAFVFQVTLPPGDLWDRVWQEARALGVPEHVENLGAQPYSDMARLYSRSDLVFVPSMLETFSATYLEALLMRRPLVVADRPFAREICGDAATYVNPLHPEACAHVLGSVMAHPADFVPAASTVEPLLARYGNQSRRYAAIVDLLERVAAGRRA